MGKLNNAKSFPEIYYGFHFEPGVAQYNPPDHEPYKILINEDAIRKMNETFVGKPVYVEHVNGVDLENLQEEADGYVIRSFFNSADGKTWVEFIVVSDRGKSAIEAGWKLSNCYVPTEEAPGGSWHGVSYSKEIKNGEFEHLAIVKNPRYEDSIIMTPEQFKNYNEDLHVELRRVANEKEKQGDKPVGLIFNRKAKVENGAEIESIIVKLPKSGKEMSITDLVMEMDKIQNMAGYAADEHLVKVNDSEEMSVKDLKKAYNKMCSDKAEMENAKDEEEKKNAEEVEGDEKKENDDENKDKSSSERKDSTRLKLDGDPAKNSKEEISEETKAKNLKKLANAEEDSRHVEEVSIDMDKMARGKARYGSN